VWFLDTFEAIDVMTHSSTIPIQCYPHLFCFKKKINTLFVYTFVKVIYFEHVNVNVSPFWHAIWVRVSGFPDPLLSDPHFWSPWIRILNWNAYPNLDMDPCLKIQLRIRKTKIKKYFFFLQRIEPSLFAWQFSVLFNIYKNLRKELHKHFLLYHC